MLTAAPQLSVIVPVLDEAAVLGATLASLQDLPADSELIVVDGGSTDGTEAVARGSERVAWLRSERGRARQMNLGAERARGRTLLFLHADTILPAGAPQMIEAALSAPGVVAGSFCLTFAPSSPMLRFYARCSRLNCTLTTFGDQGLFLRRATFHAVGGFAPLPFMEDVDMQRRLRRRGRFVKLPVPVVTSSRRFRARGPIRQQLDNCALMGLYLAGVPAERLKRHYNDER